jgi:hypothetical protein
MGEEGRGVWRGGDLFNEDGRGVCCKEFGGWVLGEAFCRRSVVICGVLFCGRSVIICGGLFGALESEMGGVGDLRSK